MNTQTLPAIDRKRGVIAFPAISASLGGAQRVEYNARTATVITSNGIPVKIARRELPPFDLWTSFNLADLADRRRTK